MRARVLVLMTAAAIAGGCTAPMPASARVAPSDAPPVIGAYHLVTDTPDDPYEDEIGWNCYVDGDGYCGGVDVHHATGFTRPGWPVSCRWYEGELVNGGRYVMCNDGSVYVKALKGSEVSA